MALTAADVAVIVEVVDKATIPLKKIAGSLKVLAGSAVATAAAFGALRAVYRSMTEAQDVTVKLERTLEGVGAKSLVTADQVNKLALEIQNVSKFSDNAAKSAAEQLVRFGVVTNRSLEPTLKITAALATQMGTDLPQAASLVARALLSPASASRSLRQAGVQLSAVQLEQIRNFEKVGDRASAQKIVMEELSRVTNGGKLEIRTFSEAMSNLNNTVGRLIQGKDGTLTGATEALLRFTETFKDPDVIIGADRLMTTLADGLTKILNLLVELDDFKSSVGAIENKAGSGVARNMADFLRAISPDGSILSDVFAKGLDNNAGLLELRANRTRDSGRKGGRKNINIEEGKLANIGGIPELTEFNVTASKIHVSAMAEFYRNMDENTRTSVEKQIAELNKIDLELQELFKQGEDPRVLAARWKEALDAALPEVKAGGEIIGKTLTDSFNKLDVFADEAFRGIQNSIQQFLVDPFNDGLKGLAKGILETFRNVLAQMAAESIMRGIFKGATGSSGFLGKALGWVGSAFGFRAGGGAASGATIVGENGPELVTSGINSMRVYNRSQMAYAGGGRGGINYSPQTVFNVSGDVSDKTKAELIMYVERARKQDQQGVMQMLKNNGFGRMR